MACNPPIIVEQDASVTLAYMSVRNWKKMHANERWKAKRKRAIEFTAQLKN